MKARRLLPWRKLQPAGTPGLPPAPPLPTSAADGRDRFWAALWWVSAVFAVYLLSTGPYVRLQQAGYIPKALDNIYAPLEPLFPDNSPQQRLIWWYVFTVWKAEFPAVY